MPHVPPVPHVPLVPLVLLVLNCVCSPPSMPQPVQTRLNADLNKILQRPDVRTALLGQGLEPSPISAEEFGTLIKADIQKSRTIIVNANIKVEQ